MKIVAKTKKKSLTSVCIENCDVAQFGNIYVDNVITGVDTLSDAKDLYIEAKSPFAAASINLREWALYHMKTKL